MCGCVCKCWRGVCVGVYPYVQMCGCVCVCVRVCVCVWPQHNLLTRTKLLLSISTAQESLLQILASSMVGSGLDVKVICQKVTYKFTAVVRQAAEAGAAAMYPIARFPATPI